MSTFFFLNSSTLLLVADIHCSDHIEGEAVVSERNAHAHDDGHIDREEKKALERAHKRQLANRQRGINGFKPFRTGKWMKQGIVSRVMPTKNSAKRERELPLFPPRFPVLMCHS